MAYTPVVTPGAGNPLADAWLATYVEDNFNETFVAKASAANQIPRSTGANALAVVSAGLVGGTVANWRHVAASADVSINTQITPQNDADLVQAVLANEIWLCRGQIVVFCADATVDFRYDFAVPAGADGGRSGAHVSPTGDSINNDTSMAGDFQIDVNAGRYAVIDISAYLVNGATPGNWQFRWSQGTSSGTNMTRKKGSYLEFLNIT